jgi:hypothetical protein
MDIRVIRSISTILANGQSYIDAIEFPYFISFYN